MSTNQHVEVEAKIERIDDMHCGGPPEVETVIKAKRKEAEALKQMMMLETEEKDGAKRDLTLQKVRFSSLCVHSLNSLHPHLAMSSFNPLSSQLSLFNASIRFSYR